MAYLRILLGDQLLKDRELTAARTSIGRAADNDIVLRSKGVSKHHAVILRDGHSYFIVDTQSANGVYVNSRRVKHQLLNYWDEIQVFDHLLKFMAVARLPGDVDDEHAAPPRTVQQEATMELDISKLRDLASLRRPQNVAYLAVNGGQDRYLLDKVNFTLGRARNCDVRLPGWLPPRITASIQRRSDSARHDPKFLLIPAWGSRIYLNGTRLTAPAELSDDDELQVRSLELTFRFGPFSET